ncbi:MAG TPA: DUF1385 domain-containing protein [Thermoanaerobaculia bacterium]|nr:DUF1385 domain-containing protein [Thermoanaerobaculia bacterium]
MRSPGAYGVAVRRPDGSLALQRGKVFPLGKRWPILKLPILRGCAVLFQSLYLGIKALNFSAEQAAGGDAQPNDSNAPAAPAKKELSTWAIAGSMATGLGLGVLLFLLLPLWLTQMAEKHWLGPLSSLSFNLLDGGLRGVFFLLYIYLISRMKDIHRVFMYHGAEHKVVFAWEKQGPLTVDAARAQSRLHPRCGTSFLLFVLLVSIVLFALIPKTAPFLLKLGGRLVLVPVVAGLSYEVLRLTARKRAAPLFAALVAPGLALQRITTQEPTDDMLQVAIVALEEALREDGLLAEAA